MLNRSVAEESRRKINDSQAFDDPAHYGGESVEVNNVGTAHVSAMDKDGSAVSYSTSINNMQVIFCNILYCRDQMDRLGHAPYIITPPGTKRFKTVQ